MGYEGDAYGNQANKAARLDGVRISYSGTNDAQRIEALFTAATGGSSGTDGSAVVYHSFSLEGAALAIEYDETAGWLTSDAASGAVFEQATDLASDDWTVVSADQTVMLDWYADRKSYRAWFDSGPERTAFYRLQQ
jgi:hypothetical protein